METKKNEMRRGNAMRKMVMLLMVIFLLGTTSAYADETTNKIVFESGFENGLKGWDYSSNNKSAEKPFLEKSDVKEGTSSLKLFSVDSNGWILTSDKYIPVKAGETYQISAWIKADEKLSTSVCFNTYGKSKNQIDFEIAQNNDNLDGEWTHVVSQLVVKKGVSFIKVRLFGWDSGQLLVDNVTCTKVNVSVSANVPDVLTITNTVLNCEFDTKTMLFSVKDKRNGFVWTQKEYRSDLLLQNAFVKDNVLNLEFYFGKGNSKVLSKVSMVGENGEISVTISGDGALGSAALVFPQPFVSGKGTDLIIPVSEGMSVPVDDETAMDIDYEFSIFDVYSMPFSGITDGKKGMMFINNTPNDAQIGIHRVNNILCSMPIWSGQKGEFGYDKKLTYVFFDNGGLTAIAKRYRDEAKSLGYIKTLKEKLKENPNVDKIVGSANVWDMSKSFDIAKDLKSLGMDRAMYSYSGGSSYLFEQFSSDNLVSAYECMLESNHPNMGEQPYPWSIAQKGWENNDLVTLSNQKPYIDPGYPTSYLCSQKFRPYAEEWIESDYKHYNFNARFVDAFFMFRECYSPEHPATKSDSIKAATDYLGYLSKNKGLVVGTENSEPFFVPYTHYAEGNMTLVAGTDRRNEKPEWIEFEPLERVEKYQVGQKYRIPLWELVFHDCSISYWHWFDANNRFPTLWLKKDMFNVLYGTPPMYVFNLSYWNSAKEDFKASYDRVIPVARAVGYEEMTDFQYLTSNRDVQMTSFSNGVKVVVNFGTSSYTYSDGSVIKPMDYKAYGLESVKPVVVPDTTTPVVEGKTPIQEKKDNSFAMIIFFVVVGLLSILTVAIFVLKRSKK